MAATVSRRGLRPGASAERDPAPARSATRRQRGTGASAGAAIGTIDGMSQPAPLPDALLAGFRRFRAGRYPDERDRYRRLADEGQTPAAMVIACSDSRSGPEIVFDAIPGDLFVVRNVAALVPAYAPDAGQHGASAALEYAVRTLGTSSIVVLGHGRCGGIEAALQPGFAKDTDFVGTWVEGLRELAAEVIATTADPADARLGLELRSIERSLGHLLTFPWIRDRVDAGELQVAGAWFDIAIGELDVLGDDGWVRVDAG